MMAMVKHIDSDTKIHLLDVENSRIELACGYSFEVDLPHHLDVEETVEVITEVARKKGVIGPKDVIACFFN